MYQPEKVQLDFTRSDGRVIVTHTCDACMGEGRIVSSGTFIPCLTCDGAGKVTQAMDAREVHRLVSGEAT